MVNMVVLLPADVTVRCRQTLPTPPENYPTVPWRYGAKPRTVAPLEVQSPYPPFQPSLDRQTHIRSYSPGYFGVSS